MTLSRRRGEGWNRLASGLYVPPLLGFAGNGYPCQDCCRQPVPCGPCADTLPEYHLSISVPANWSHPDGEYIVTTGDPVPQPWPAVCVDSCTSCCNIPYIFDPPIVDGDFTYYAVLLVFRYYTGWSSFVAPTGTYAGWRYDYKGNPWCFFPMASPDLHCLLPDGPVTLSGTTSSCVLSEP